MAKKPFRILSERASNSLLCTGVPAIRTFFALEGDIFIPLLKDPEEFEENKARAEELSYEPTKEEQSWQGPTISY